jgi:hypothetical protein
MGARAQAKALILPAQNNSWPGVAVALGALAPAGYGPFTPPGWSGFGYVALTESLWDEWLLAYYGDPYDPRFSHPAVQLGFRYIFNEHVQLDGTFGGTLRRSVAADGHVQTQQWGTLGLRLVTPELW